MVPKEAQIACLKEWSPPMADLVCDAMYAVIRGAKTPKVDLNRLYLTGLSYGGRAAWTFPFGYPGRFAASIPVAGYANAETVPDSNPGSFWFVYNEGEYASEKARRGLADMARVVAERPRFLTKGIMRGTRRGERMPFGIGCFQSRTTEARVRNVLRRQTEEWREDEHP